MAQSLFCVHSGHPPRRGTAGGLPLALAMIVAAIGAAGLWSSAQAADMVEPVGTIAASAPADATCAEVDVWVVSTRRLPGICHMPRAADVHVERRVAASRWERSDVDTLLGDPSRPLVVFIHGNRYETGIAKAQGVTLARRLTAACPAGEPVRTVIFSWPSEQQGILLRDGRQKYDRARADGHYLAWLLGRVEPQRPVAIVGYSFGALIALEAIDDLVAAERHGHPDVQPWLDRPGRTHLVFIAAAVRCDAVAPGGPYREALGCIDRLILVNNSSDNALKFFPWLDHDLGLEALGHVGMPRRWVPEHVEHATTDAAGIVGRSHGLPLYLASPALTRRIAAVALEGLTP